MVIILMKRKELIKEIIAGNQLLDLSHVLQSCAEEVRI